MSDASASDVLLGTVARNIFLAGFKAGEVYNGKTGYDANRAERAWDEYEPSEEDKAEVQALDARLSAHEETSAEIASLAGQVLGLTEIEPHHTNASLYNALLRSAKSLAGSALTQRENHDGR